MIKRGTDFKYGSVVSIGEPELIPEGNWPFKEPEKSTALDEDQDAKERAAAQAELDRIRAAKSGLKALPAALATEMAKGTWERDEDFIKAQKRQLEIDANMSPPGALRLPAKLEAARWKWKIEDKAFERQAQFRRIHIIQVDMNALLQPEADNFFPGTSIERPSVTKRRDEEGCHMGILISAGLTALDELHSHGTELGNLVGFIRNAPMRHTYSRSEHGESYYLVLNAGDITCDETLGQELIAGKRYIVDEGGESGYCHVLGGQKKKAEVFQSEHW